MSPFQLPKPKTVNVDGVTIPSTCFAYDVSQRKRQRLKKKIKYVKEGIGHVKEDSVVKVLQWKEKYESMKKEQSKHMVEESKDISESASEVLVSALSVLAALESRASDEEEFSLAIQDAKGSTVRINLIA